MNTEKVLDIVDEVIDGHDKHKRSNDWIGIVVHHTGIGGRTEVDDSLWKKLYKNLSQWLATKDANYLSAHFVIGRQGEITQIVNPDHYVAYHAGTSTFWHPQKRMFVSNMNEFMIGIELLGDGNIMPYSESQYKSAGRLCSELMKRYPTIQPNCIQGHEIVSPGRKVDPGKHFAWRWLFSEIYRT